MARRGGRGRRGADIPNGDLTGARCNGGNGDSMVSEGFGTAGKNGRRGRGERGKIRERGEERALGGGPPSLARQRGKARARRRGEERPARSLQREEDDDREHFSNRPLAISFSFLSSPFSFYFSVLFQLLL